MHELLEGRIQWSEGGVVFCFTFGLEWSKGGEVEKEAFCLH